MPAGSTGCLRRTLRGACASFRWRARWRGATFFQPETKLLQQTPDPARAQRNTGLGREPALRLSQRQIGLCGHPIHHLTLRLDSGGHLRSLMRHTLSTAVAVPLRRKLFSPPEAHSKTIRKLFQRLFALIAGRQKLTAQVIPIGSRHRFVLPQSLAKTGLHCYRKCLKWVWVPARSILEVRMIGPIIPAPRRSGMKKSERSTRKSSGTGSAKGGHLKLVAKFANEYFDRLIKPFLPFPHVGRCPLPPRDPQKRLDN